MRDLDHTTQTEQSEQHAALISDAPREDGSEFVHRLSLEWRQRAMMVAKTGVSWRM
jgi:hypothetical protein